MFRNKGTTIAYTMYGRFDCHQLLQDRGFKRKGQKWGLIFYATCAGRLCQCSHLLLTGIVDKLRGRGTTKISLPPERQLEVKGLFGSESKHHLSESSMQHTDTLVVKVV